MNAVSGSILAFLLLVVAFAPRRWALLAMLAGVFYLTQGHSLEVAGLNLYPLRFLEAFAFARVLIRRELVVQRWVTIDRVVLLLYGYTALISIVRSVVTSAGVTAQQFAFAMDPTLCYMAFRGLIRTHEDVVWLMNAFVVLLVPFTALVFLERVTGHSSFTLVGSTGSLYFREGVPRCMGSFRHAILLGSVAASFLPVYAGLALRGARQISAFVGATLCIALVVLSNSGGPLTSASAAVVGWSLWPLRKHMHLVRRVVVFFLLFLLGFMKAPIWYLPFKISAAVGGGGYHRGVLMEQAWQNMDQWWLAGMKLEDTAGWFPYVHALVGGADITNEFVALGITGGLLAIVLMIVLLSLAFKKLGCVAASLRYHAEKRSVEVFVWGLGVAVFVHIVTWLGVSYFDQSWAVWLLHLAAVSSLAHLLPREPASASIRPRLEHASVISSR